MQAVAPGYLAQAFLLCRAGALHILDQRLRVLVEAGGDDIARYLIDLTRPGIHLPENILGCVAHASPFH